MSVRKHTYKDHRTGELRRTENYYCYLTDHQRIRRRLPGFKSLAASRELDRKVQLLVDIRKAGDRPTSDLLKWLETLEPQMCAKLAEWGILDRQRVAASKPLSAHLEDYESAMLAKGDSERHIREEVSKIRKILAGCGFRAWSDISASRLQAYLGDLRHHEGISIRTSNGYLIAFKAFCNWCVRDRRASESPVQHLSRLNARVDVRRKRRALSADESRRLVETAHCGPVVRGMPGPERAMLYRLAMETGLRWSELRSLRRSSFDLEGVPPTVTVEAAYSKHKREDVQPLRADTATALKAFFAASPALSEGTAFPHMPRGRYGAKLMRADLEAAGIPYEDKTGAVADFHSLRHSFVSALARGGVPPKTAMDLARHSDVNLTMRVYSHTAVQTRSKALDVLPDLDAPSRTQEGRATGTDGKSCLVPCLAQNGQATPIQADANRPIRGGKSRGPGQTQSPVNPEETLNSQDDSVLAEDLGFEPRLPDPESGVLPLHQSSAFAFVAHATPCTYIRQAQAWGGCRCWVFGWRGRDSIVEADAETERGRAQRARSRMTNTSARTGMRKAQCVSYLQLSDEVTRGTS